ncbi:MAG: hypothetical protein ACFB0E_05710 [Leptolyngbyaceae cyanobacterium]
MAALEDAWSSGHISRQAEHRPVIAGRQNLYPTVAAVCLYNVNKVVAGLQYKNDAEIDYSPRFYLCG